MVARTNAERHDCERWILAWIRGEAAGVHDEEIFHVVRLLELIQDRFLGIETHARRAGFVKGPARRGRMRVGVDVFGAGRFEHFSGGIADVLDHGGFVFAVGHVDFHDGNAVDVFDGRIELNEILPARQNFTEAGDADSHLRFSQRFFVDIAETGRAPIEIDAGFAFIAVAAQETLRCRLAGQIAEASDVDAYRFSGTAHGWSRAEDGIFTAAAGTADVSGEIVAENSAGICETVGMLGRCRVEQDARGFLGLGAKDDDARMDFFLLLCDAVDIKDAGGAILIGIHQDFVGHGVRNERAVLRAQSVRDGTERRVEIGVGHAAALAGATIVAGAAAVERLRKIRGPAGHRRAAELLLDVVAKQRFLAGERHRGLELSVGKMFEALFGAADADVLFDEVVIGLDVFVRERPIFAEAVAGSGFEIEVTVTKRNAAPDVGAAAGHSNAPHPEKRVAFGRGVRLFEIVGEPVSGVFVADVKDRLDRPRLSNEIRRHVAIFQIEFGFVFGKVGVGLRAAGFEQSDFEAGFREALARPAAGSAGANDDDIELFIR